MRATSQPINHLYRLILFACLALVVLLAGLLPAGCNSGSSSNNSSTKEPVSYTVEPVAVVQRLLNDTGIDWWANASQNNLTSAQAEYPGQDADHGRDAEARAGTLAKIGGGEAGFDFTKLGADGEPLAVQGIAWAGEGSEEVGSRWSCVLDNRTGLIWEVKTTSESQNYTYSWYNSDINTNGGHAGTANTGTCVDDSNCDTEKFVAQVNAAGLCGANDWRLPTDLELLSIVHNGRTSPAIDGDYFPNTPSQLFWSSSPYADGTGSAWFVGFDYGYAFSNGKGNNYRVRLVRAGQ